MVKYGPAGGRGHPVHILETETLLRPPCLWLGGSAPQASDQRWRRPRVHPLPPLPPLLVPGPSSAAAERVFSILNSSFNDSQDHALVDYL